MAYIKRGIRRPIGQWLRSTVRQGPWNFLLLLFGIVAGSGALYLQLAAANDWEPAIAAFEAQDRRQPPPPDQVLFVGGSSIRLWDNLATDMAPVPVLKRGISGAQLRDLLYYADRWITPYRPRAVVIYAGENDLASWWVWPGLVEDRFQRLVKYLRQRDPTLPILMLAIKPSPRFAARLERQQEANRRLRAYCAATPDLYFVDVASPLLDAQGRMRPELYRDGLHLNGAGYAIWRAQLRPALLTALGHHAGS